MNSKSEFSEEEAKKLAEKDEKRAKEAEKLADEIVFKHTGKHLSTLEAKVLKGAIKRKTYEEIYKETGYAVSYLNNDIGGPLWRKLSEALGEDVSKTNLWQPLKRYQEKQASSGNTIHTSLTAPPPEATPPTGKANNLELPGGRMPLDSRFYIERHDVESSCYETIRDSGALIRIKAPQEMGKTSLLERILAKAAKQDYRIVSLSFETDTTVFSNTHKFLRYFCACVSKRLEMDNQLDNYWDDIYGYNENVINYFEEYLLPGCSNPLVLALDKVDFVFEQPAISTDFCRLIRACYDLARRSGDRGAIWKKLRWIVVHSTEVYSSLDINFSPLQGVGCVVLLEDFSREQVIELARRYELNCVATEIEELMNLVGGHPHLVRLAFEYLKSHKVSLEKLLQIASTEENPFCSHLRQHLCKFKERPELAIAFRQVVTANAPVRLNSNEAFKLQSMGLVKPKSESDGWIPSRDLYSQYFSAQL